MSDSIQSVTDAELSAEVERRIRARHTPPEDFTLDTDATSLQALAENPEWSGVWSGPEYGGDGWKVTTAWDSDDGLSVWLDADHDNPFRVSQIPAIREALATVATLGGAL